MKASSALNWLVPLVAVLALTAAGAGLFWPGDGSPYPFNTLFGSTIQINGQGLYHFDSFFKAPILRGTDAVTFFVLVPLLMLAYYFQRRGSLRSRLFMTGVLSFFLYNSVSIALGTAYNPLFLLYIAYFSASLFAFLLSWNSVRLEELSAAVSPNLPRKRIAAFLWIAGMNVFVWLIPLVSGLVQGQAPESLQNYTTDLTAVLDIAIIFPSAVLAGVLLLRRQPLGFLLGWVMLTLNAVIGLVVIAQTTAQSLAGIRLGEAQFAIFVGTFVIMSLAAASMLGLLYRATSDGHQSGGAVFEMNEGN